MAIDQDLKEALRRALEMVGLVNSGESPNAFVNDEVKALEPNYPAMTPQGAIAACTMLNKTAQAAAMLVNFVMTQRENDGGPTVQDQTAELGQYVNSLGG